MSVDAWHSQVAIAQKVMLYFTIYGTQCAVEVAWRESKTRKGSGARVAMKYADLVDIKTDDMAMFRYWPRAFTQHLREVFLAQTGYVLSTHDLQDWFNVRVKTTRNDTEWHSGQGVALKGCPRCGGDMVIQYCESVCLQCGYDK